MCGSDLHTFCGLRQKKTPIILGHEIVGRVYPPY
ncbi:alcohol dehydrogenase catalytic domain-containing protein [Dyadobacter helix]|nr:alcohol dehydrogenase catalytic domain-containing protein [Dyadobacter sp. CECT 9275]